MDGKKEKMKRLRNTAYIMVISVIILSPLLLLIHWKYLAVVFMVWLFMVIYYVFLRKSDRDDPR